MDNDFTLQPLDLKGVETLVAWAKAEGWNPGLYDAQVFYATDPNGFYGYFIKDELIAGGALVSYNGVYGFMGLFIVKPSYRGKGIGRTLWYQRRDTLIRRLQPNAAIGMDGVVAMQSFYGKGGFVMNFKDFRFEKRGVTFPENLHITSIEAASMSELLKYDTVCFGTERPQFLIPWLLVPETKSFQYVTENKLQGFAVLRKASEGYKIGPLFADTPEIAAALYEACLNAVVGELVYLDIPETNEAAVQMVNTYKANYVFECGRMYYGQPPEIPLHKIYGITSFELG